MAEDYTNHSTIKPVANDAGMTVNGGIGSGINDGGPAYCIEVVNGTS